MSVARMWRRIGNDRPEPCRVLEWSPAQFSASAEDAMSIYARAMGYSARAGRQRAATARSHAHHDGFACRVALHEDRVVGFGYGYTTRPGQWWHDLVNKALSGDLANEWLTDAFELSELHVLPDYQGAGIGHRLLTALAAPLPHAHMLL
jgi:GNAT superfamily N-acetyltransferase